MARAQATTLWGEFCGELAAATLYKRNQGKLIRQLTGAAVFLVFGLGAYVMSQTILLGQPQGVKFGIPAAIAVFGAWLAFRVVNMPRFADFLISVEGELHKVTWASRNEVYRATIVVIATMFLFGAILAAYDALWSTLLSALGILKML
jgi:preprotein translocase subunit SecE